MNYRKSIKKQSKKIIRSTTGFLLFLSFPLFSFSQSNNTSSPYTRYGYGILADQSFAAQRAMGGIGYGLRNSKIINPLNPASFSAVDSMTFMLDFGIKGQAVLFKDGSNKSTKYNASLEYLAMQFPLVKGLGMGIGIEPISYVGYQNGDTTRLNQLDGLYYESYNGKGGLNKIYSTLSYKISNRLSLGVKVGYMFGDVIHSRSVTPNLSNSFVLISGDTLRSAGLNYEFGLQYFHSAGKNRSIVIGAVYTPKTPMRANVMKGESSYNSITGSIESSKDTVYTSLKFQFPETYAIGISYQNLNRLTLGADFQYQRWADAQYYNKTDSLLNRMKISIGLEYIPNALGHNFFSKLRYRAGANYSNSYFKANDWKYNESGYKEYGATLGFGIPMIDKRSFINLAFGYTFVRPELTTLVSEHYFKFTLSYTFNEWWFFKRKLQ